MVSAIVATGHPLQMPFDLIEAGKYVYERAPDNMSPKY
jgi:hypothetical protein